MLKLDTNSEGYKKLIEQINKIILGNDGKVNEDTICNKLGISQRFAEQLIRSMGYHKGSDFRDH